MACVSPLTASCAHHSSKLRGRPTPLGLSSGIRLNARDEAYRLWGAALRLLLSPLPLIQISVSLLSLCDVAANSSIAFIYCVEAAGVLDSRQRSYRLENFMNRRDALRSTAAMLASSAALAASSASSTTRTNNPPGQRYLTRPLASADRITEIYACSRPFRPSGPRIEREVIGTKTIIHNYGHGGSGWTLSWGSSNLAMAAVTEYPPRNNIIGVIGCGPLGLTSAILAQRAGYQVTIYAREIPPATASMGATGHWSPDSQLCTECLCGPCVERAALRSQGQQQFLSACCSLFLLSYIPILNLSFASAISPRILGIIAMARGAAAGSVSIPSSGEWSCEHSFL